MGLLLDRIFPIRDAASARFMQVKAHCLLRAGVITRAQKAQVDEAAANALMQAAEGMRHRDIERAVGLATPRGRAA